MREARDADYALSCQLAQVFIFKFQAATSGQRRDIGDCTSMALFESIILTPSSPAAVGSITAAGCRGPILATGAEGTNWLEHKDSERISLTR